MSEPGGIKQEAIVGTKSFEYELTLSGPENRMLIIWHLLQAAMLMHTCADTSDGGPLEKETKLHDLIREKVKDEHIGNSMSAFINVWLSREYAEYETDPCHGPDDAWCPVCGLGGDTL